MFGEDPKVGLTSSSLPPEILGRLQTEDDLVTLHQSTSSATTDHQLMIQDSLLPRYSHNKHLLPSVSHNKHLLPLLPPVSHRNHLLPLMESGSHNKHLLPPPPPVSQKKKPASPHGISEPQQTPASPPPTSEPQEPPASPHGISEPQQTPASPPPTSEPQEPPASPHGIREPQQTPASPPPTSEPQEPSASPPISGLQVHVPPPPIMEQPSLSPLDKRLQEFTSQRKRARQCQLSQAERMVKCSRIELKVAEVVNDNAATPIPMVDKDRGDPRNILGVVVDRDENDLYKIAVKDGILSTKYSRNQFNLCPQRLLSDTDVNTHCTTTLRQALKSTPSGGQGFFHCDSTKGKKQCQTNRCKCFKAKRLCNSRCYSSLTCRNK